MKLVSWTNFPTFSNHFFSHKLRFNSPEMPMQRLFCQSTEDCKQTKGSARERIENRRARRRKQMNLDGFLLIVSFTSVLWLRFYESFGDFPGRDTDKGDSRAAISSSSPSTPVKIKSVESIQARHLRLCSKIILISDRSPKMVMAAMRSRSSALSVVYINVHSFFIKIFTKHNFHNFQPLSTNEFVTVDIVKQLFFSVPHRAAQLRAPQTHAPRLNLNLSAFISQSEWNCKLENCFRTTQIIPRGLGYRYTIGTAFSTLPHTPLESFQFPHKLLLINILIKNFQCVNSAPIASRDLRCVCTLTRLKCCFRKRLALVMSLQTVTRASIRSVFLGL